MMFGMSLATYTLIHVLISVVGLVTGFVVLAGLISGKRLDRWTAVFLGTTIATSLTGFGFPFTHLLPSHIVGIISLVVLAIACAARYAFQAMPPWGRIYAVTACIALYLNVFVAIAQAFQKIPILKAIAPTQTEAPFALAQLTVLAAFIMLGTLAARRSRGLMQRPDGAMNGRKAEAA
jgi:hypothetical protein